MSRIYDMVNIPSAAEYAKGLDAIRARLSEKQLRLLVSQYYSNGRRVTAGELAQLAGISGGYSTVNLLYGRMGRLFCEEFGIYPEMRPDATHRWWSVWSKGWRSQKGFIWEMRPQVAKALELLGWVDSDLAEFQLAQNERPGSLFEGSVRRVTTTVRERNPYARARCIIQHGTKCSVCDMSFEEVYGEEAKGYIHVHHITPLSSWNEVREIDPAEDLRPVCPNCHAVIHLGGRTRSIEEVREMLRRSQSS